LPIQPVSQLPSLSAVSARRVAVRPIALGIVLAGTAVAGVAYSFFTLFNRFPFYDDEGKMLILVQHLLQGQAVFDELHCGYGPFYCFERWVLFGVLGLPLCNDAFRAVSVLTWVLTAFMLALSAWRLARDTGWASGLAAIVWFAAIFHLSVLSNEPGHPQELIVLLLAAAFLIAVEMWNRWSDATLMLLGAITGALICTKINVGAAFGLGLGMALVSLGPRRSITWTLLRSLAALAVLAVPTVLMRSRLADGYGSFCFHLTAALFPCCLLALFRIEPRGVGWRHLLLCGLGAALAMGSLIGFAMMQGNTVAGLIQALIVGNWHLFAQSKYGGPLALPRLIVYWSLLGAGLGLGVLLVGPRWSRFLWPLRLFVCALIFTDALVARSWDSQATWLSLPLIWLLLVPPSGREPQVKGWFFRLLLTFTVCLQPIQIFPIAQSQLHIGTLMMVLAGVVLLVDLSHELEAVDRPTLPAAVAVRLALSIVGIASLTLVYSGRVYDIFGKSVELPSVNSVWTLVAGGMGLIVLWGGSWPRRFLRPLRLLASALFFGCVAIYRFDSDWMRFALPLLWLLLIPPARGQLKTRELLFRVLLALAACMRPLRILPVDGAPFYFPTLAMMLAGIVLLCDFLEIKLVELPRLGPLAVDWNIVLGSLALLVGGFAAFDSVSTYEKLAPLELRGCRWTRVPERDAALYEFLAANVHDSSDCFVARNGLKSLHFWADRPPVGNVLLANEWDGLDSTANELLLSAHRDHIRMMFIDNPMPWYLDSYKVEFSKLAAVLRAHEFFDFVGQHFKLLARVANCRLLVRKERKNLDLFYCAYAARIDPRHKGNSRLRLKLPEHRELKDVAKIDLVDLDSGQQIGSTAPDSSGQHVLLLNSAGREILPNADGTSSSKSLDPDRQFFLVCPTEIRFDRESFPAVRFLNSRGERLLTLPVAVEISLATP